MEKTIYLESFLNCNHKNMNSCKNSEYDYDKSIEVN